MPVKQIVKQKPATVYWNKAVFFFSFCQKFISLFFFYLFSFFVSHLFYLFCQVPWCPGICCAIWRCSLGYITLAHYKTHPRTYKSCILTIIINYNWILNILWIVSPYCPQNHCKGSWGNMEYMGVGRTVHLATMEGLA